jgi:hypothetical protein
MLPPLLHNSGSRGRGIRDLESGEGAVSSEELEERYARVSGHSLRRGFDTTALLRGVDSIRISNQTATATLK